MTLNGITWSCSEVQEYNVKQCKNSELQNATRKSFFSDCITVFLPKHDHYIPRRDGRGKMFQCMAINCADSGIDIVVQELYPSDELPVVVDLQSGYFCKKTGMSKNESVREQMFASIVSLQQSDLSQKEWCRQQTIPYHIIHYWYRVYREEHPQPNNEDSFVD